MIIHISINIVLAYLLTNIEYQNHFYIVRMNIFAQSIYFYLSVGKSKKTTYLLCFQEDNATYFFRNFSFLNFNLHK